MDSIEAALADLRLQDKPNVSATADKHKVERSTLSRRWNKVTRSREDGYDSMRFLSTIQSKALIKYINDLTERGLPPTVQMVRNLAAGIAGKQPGNHWTARWLAAHKNELKSGYLPPIDIARKKADSALYYSLYFELLGRKIAEYNIQPENTIWTKRAFLSASSQNQEGSFPRKLLTKVELRISVKMAIESGLLL